MIKNPLALWAIVAIVGIAAVLFGAISVTTNLFTAVGIALIVVGALYFFTPTHNAAVGLALVAGGAVLWIFNGAFKPLTIQDALSFVGWGG